MKQNTKATVLLALSIFGAANLQPALATGLAKENYVSPARPARISDRLIVKLRPNYLPKGLSVAQISSELGRPFTGETVSRMQAAAGLDMTELHALSNGAHVLSIQGKPTRQALDRAVAGIAALADVEYVEVDEILTLQAAPSDTFYTTYSGNPGLWAMWHVTPVASPAPGGTGSYGADFEAAWAATTGTGVVIAIVDTGITPHVDIVGTGGTVSPATGNLVSPGYDFISDCRMRGTCPANTPSVSAVVAAAPNASDRGDFITAADTTTIGSLFYGLTPSDSSWHGTHVAGTIAAIGNNGAGVIGGAYDARILPVRVLGKGGGLASDFAEAIKWAAGVHPTIANPDPASIINLSVGRDEMPMCPITIQAAINAAVAAGAAVVVAAGNSNSDVAFTAPANCDNVISVAAMARDGSRAAYSNYSSPATNISNPKHVTLAAQGGDQASYDPSFDPGILSTVNSSVTSPNTGPGGSVYTFYQGTSMATPHVTAAVALMRARNPALTPAEIKTILSAPASVTAFPSFSVFPAYDCATSRNCGAGILNAMLAVQNSVAPLSSSLATVDFGSLSTNATVSKTVTLTNSTQGSLSAGVPLISGADATFFSPVTNTCNAVTISPLGTCQVTMNYAPTAAGIHLATLSVPLSASGVTTTIGLTGIAGSPLTVATPTAAAPTVPVGRSTTVNLAFSNPNPVAVKVGVVSLSNPVIMATSVDNCSNAMLGAAATCVVTVTITPAAVGAYSETAAVSLSAGGTPTQVTISGAADPAPPPSSGGGCSVMPAGADPDSSLPLAMLVMLAYWLRRRVTRPRGAA